MNRLAEQVFARRATRNAARARLMGRVDSLKADVEERGLVGRIVDDVAGEALATFDEAMSVARDSKGIIAGTIAALALWFVRKPMISWLKDTLDSRKQAQGPGNDDE